MRHVPCSVLAFALLAACGGGTTGTPSPAPTPSPPASPTPSPSPGDPLAGEIAAARAEILADTCFRQGGGNCAWSDQPYRPADFAMAPNSGEAILIVDDLPRLPVRSIRFRKRIKGYFRLAAGGDVTPATTSWRVPTSLWNALDRFSGPDHVPAQRLADLAAAAETSYAGMDFDNVGHGSYVFSLIADTNPAQPLVLLDAINLVRIDRDDYCDAGDSAAAQTRLVAAARHAADAIVALMRAHNVRFVNYSAGHTFQIVAEGWQRDCGTALPAEAVLRDKLAAYAPIYAALFATPGVMTAHAASETDGLHDAPYDQPLPIYPNRLRVGYFTSLASGLDAAGRGPVPASAWPAPADADIFVNTGVLPDRPFPYSRTPWLQLDGFGLSLTPITAPHTSWVAPLALARLINLRYAGFAARAFDDALIADIFAAATPAQCPALSLGRCVYQDPLLHGQIEATRLLYRPPFYD